MMRISITTRQVFVGDRLLRPTPKFFQLYCLLALHHASGHEGFLSCRDVHRLSRWAYESPASIGKEIARHARRLRAARCPLIDSPPRGATQLFRLKPIQGGVAFDLALPEVRTFLGLDLIAPAEAADDAERAFRFATALARVRAEFERGNLRAARAALHEADRAEPPLTRDRCQLLLWWSRVLEREGHYRQALARAGQAVALCSEGGADYLTLARALIWLGHLGWMSRLPQPLQEAKGHYRRAQSLLDGTQHFTELAQIATGLGHLARHAGDRFSAYGHFLAAFRYAAADGWAWGIQAALCNLGLVCMEQGDRSGSPRRREAAYQEAQRWEERCIQFADETGVGRDSTEAVSILAEVLLKRGKAEAAIRWAGVAMQRAQAAGNRKSEALALECLGQAWRAVGRRAEARESFCKAKAIYSDLGRGDDVLRLLNLLSGLNSAQSVRTLRERKGAAGHLRLLPRGSRLSAAVRS